MNPGMKDPPHHYHVSASAESEGNVSLQAGLLDDTSEVEPEVYLWNCYRQPWVTLTLPARARPFDTQPDDPMELLQAAREYRERR